MKKHFLLFMCLFVSSISALDQYEKRILRLVRPYQRAIEYLTGLDPLRQVNDHDVFIFFSRYGLYEKKDVRKFHRAVRTIKRLTYTKKSLIEKREKLELLIENLEKIENFIVHYATTYYALITYYEIAASYYYIDEHNDQVVRLMIQQFEKLGLPNLNRGRNLYKFGKKIDLDLRRLTALFVQGMLSDELIVKVNQLKIKLMNLKSKIIVTHEYKMQQAKTRILKAFGVLIPFSLVMIAATFFNAMLPGGSLFLWSAIWGLPLFIIAETVVTGHELHEAAKYNIPVHSRSLFSWFTPWFIPVTWVPRG